MPQANLALSPTTRTCSSHFPCASEVWGVIGEPRGEEYRQRRDIQGLREGLSRGPVHKVSGSALHLNRPNENQLGVLENAS